MAQRGWSPRYLDADLPIEQQIVVLEQELARIVELPSTPADLHDEFVQRLRQLRARTGV